MPQRSSDRDAQDLHAAATAVVEEAATVVEDAALVVETAAAVVQEAAAVVHETAVGTAWPSVERRSKPRLLRRFHDEGKVQWKHIAVYVPVLLLVVLIGAFVLWSFFEKQSVLIEPAPLPKVTLITTDATSPFTAAWVRLLTDADRPTGTAAILVKGRVTLAEFTGYARTWSATRRYLVARGHDPVDRLLEELALHWRDAAERRPVRWRLAVRAGRTGSGAVQA